MSWKYRCHISNSLTYLHTDTHFIHLELYQALLNTNFWQAFETRHCGFHPPIRSTTQRHSPLPVWCFDGINDTPLCHVCHSICSQTLTQHTERALRVSSVQNWPMQEPISLNAHLKQHDPAVLDSPLLSLCKVSTSVTHIPRKSHAPPAGCLLLSQGQLNAKGLFRWGSKALFSYHLEFIIVLKTCCL